MPSELVARKEEGETRRAIVTSAAYSRLGETPEGCQNRDLTYRPRGLSLCEHRSMLLSFVYLAFVSMLKLFVRRHPEHVKDIELMVLRDQLDVLPPQWGAPEAATPGPRPARRCKPSRAMKAHTSAARHAADAARARRPSPAHDLRPDHQARSGGSVSYPDTHQPRIECRCAGDETFRH
jgi:hypothetical protein